jgi:hypothetical protein
MKPLIPSAVLFAALIGANVLSCKSNSGSDSKSDCKTGEAKCACYGNHTCNDGLMCYSNLCVDPDDQGKSDDTHDTDASAMPIAGGGETDAEATPVTRPQPKPVSKPSPKPSEPSATPTGDDSPSTPSTDAPSDDAGEPTSEPIATPAEPTATEAPESDAAAPQTETEVPASMPEPTLPAGELITNGDFASGLDDWKIEIDIGSAVVQDGVLCATPAEGSEAYGVLGWPLDPLAAFTAEEGVSYELSFDAWYDAAPTYSSFEAKVGEAVEPYQAIDQWQPELSTERTHWAARFTPTATFAQTGVALILEVSGARLCFDNISVVRVE